MKALIVYYSRTGRTKKIAKDIQLKIKAEIEEIKDSKNRKGILGWLSAGRDAGAKKQTKITNVQRDPSLFDLVIIGSPTWNGTISAPVRTYIDQYQGSFRRAAVFSTGDGEESDAAYEMRQLLGEKVFTWMHLTRKNEIDNNNYALKLNQFVNKINSYMR